MDLKRRIFILGSGGMLGYACTGYFSKLGLNTFPVSRSDFDILKDPLEKIALEISNSSFVINCTGVIKQVAHSYTPLDIIKINGLFPKNLAMFCKDKNIPLIHVTTDCAFSGKKGTYSENDLFDAEDLYGISKISGESSACMVLRTSLIGFERENRSRSLLEWAFTMRNRQVSGFTNHFWNGVTSLFFAECVRKIFSENLYAEGIFHLHSPDIVSKYELLKIFNESFGLNLKISPVETETPCNRSLTSIFSLSEKVAVKNIRTQVKDLKQFFNR
jgi:dTDP-4-dehydrorhamnose reductase